MFAPIGNKPAPAKLGHDGVNDVQRQAAAAPAVQTKLAHMLNGGTQVQTQRRLQNTLDQSPRAAAQAQLVQMMADAGRTPVAQRADVQDLASEEELIQSKSAVQRQEMPDEDELLQQKPIQREEMDEDDLMQMQAATAQRQEMPDEDELMQMKDATAQRQEMPDEDELLQQKPIQRQEMDEDELMQMHSATAQLCGDKDVSQMKSVAQREDMPDEDELLQQKPVQRRANTTGMPDPLKAGIEDMSGLSMDGVQVHYNSAKPAALQAHAYTQGSDIHVAPGQERHLAHEAWHVVQQAQGRVQPTTQLQGTAINDDPALEQEADRMGESAMQFKPDSALAEPET